MQITCRTILSQSFDVHVYQPRRAAYIDLTSWQKTNKSCKVKENVDSIHSSTISSRLKEFKFEIR